MYYLYYLFIYDLTTSAVYSALLSKATQEAAAASQRGNKTVLNL